MSTLVEFDPHTHTWLLSGPATAYAVRLVRDPYGHAMLRHVYWGPRLTLAEVVTLPASPDGPDDVLGEELPAEGGQRFGPAGLLVDLGGARAVQWGTVEHHIDGGHLRITLADTDYPLAAEWHYRVRGGSDVIERWTVLRHTGVGEPITVRRADSAAWTLPPRAGWRLSQVAGEWSAEFQLQRTTLPYGETTVTSRQGVTRHQANPWLMLDGGEATEEHGEVWSMLLAWSGSWRLTARRTLADRVSVAVGAGHDGLAWQLAAGQEWVTPVSAGLHCAGGFGATSRQWHRYFRSVVLPAADETRPVLYNTWEGSWFTVDEPSLLAQAERAAGIGVELFVVDDGWFGARTSDHAGLGDWWPNPERFPHGLGPLIRRVHQLGMRFGLWVEPEMVNPDSALYRAHPDWVLHQPARRRGQLRQQLVLNLARAEVAEWVHDTLHQLLATNDIDFLKWDSNRAFTEAGWPDGADPDRLWFDYTHQVYSIMDRLRASFPRLRIESCASGGGRVDAGILARTDQVWTSDNTDPVDRIAIQHGFSQVYPAVTMAAWASDSPNPLNQRRTPVRFRCQVAMAGVLGISGDLRQWPPEELAQARELVTAYRRVRHVVQHGDLYRLTPPRLEGVTAVQYVQGGESVVLVWRALARHGMPQPPLRLRGLDPAAAYELVDIADAAAGAAVHSGAVLCHFGLTVALPPGDHASAVIHLRRAPSATPDSATPGSATPGSTTLGSTTPGSTTPG